MKPIFALQENPLPKVSYNLMDKKKGNWSAIPKRDFMGEKQIKGINVLCLKANKIILQPNSVFFGAWKGTWGSLFSVHVMRFTDDLAP